MASRPELIQLCKELELKCEGLSILEMTAIIRKELDRKFVGKPYRISCLKMSENLVKFLVRECDFSLRKKDKIFIDYAELRKEE